jgi:hypothetical protein
MGDARTQIRQRINSTAIHVATVDQAGLVGPVSQVVKLDVVAQKLSFQAPATLDATVEVSVLQNGPFVSAGTLTAGGIISYSTHLVTWVKITATSGSGSVAIIAV